MDSIKPRHRASILFSPNSGNGLVDENKIINDVTTTSIEKVIKVLKKIKNLLVTLKVDKEVLEEMDWATLQLQGKSLYNFDNITADVQALSKNNSDIKNFLELLLNYSNNDGGTTPTNDEIHRTHQQRHSEVYKQKRNTIIKRLEQRPADRNFTVQSPRFFVRTNSSANGLTENSKYVKLKKIQEEKDRDKEKEGIINFII